MDNAKRKYRNINNGKVGWNTPEQAAIFPFLEEVDDDAKDALPILFKPGKSEDKKNPAPVIPVAPIDDKED